MAETLKLQIVTPEAIEYSEDVDMVTLPGVVGQMGVYPQHVPLMTQMVPGEMIVRKDGRDNYLVRPGETISITVTKPAGSPSPGFSGVQPLGFPMYEVSNTATEVSQAFQVPDSATDTLFVDIVFAFTRSRVDGDEFALRVEGSQSGVGVPAPLVVRGPYSPQHRIIGFQPI